MAKKDLLVAFVGPSCAGKSTCYEYAHSFLNSNGYTVFRRDVAYPLRRIQKYSYDQFGIGYPGDPDKPESFRQDGRLLAFLAGHFEKRLGWRFEREIEILLKGNYVQPLAIINTDCRNNTYESLKKLRFTFVRVDAMRDVLKQRRLERGDLTPFDPKASVEQHNLIRPDFVILNNGTKDELAKSVQEIIKNIIYLSDLYMIHK